MNLDEGEGEEEFEEFEELPEEDDDKKWLQFNEFVSYIS